MPSPSISKRPRRTQSRAPATVQPHPGLSVHVDGMGMRVATIVLERDMKLASVEVRKFAGFHGNIPLKEGVTNVPHLTITQGPRRTLRVAGIVLATAEKPHQILAGIDAFSTALHLANETMASSVFLTAWLIPNVAINSEFWGTWPLWESALAAQSTSDRSALATQLIRIDHPFVKGENLKYLGSVFGLSTRLLKRIRQIHKASRSYRRKYAPVSPPAVTNGTASDTTDPHGAQS